MFKNYKNNKNILIIKNNFINQLVDELRLEATKSKRFLEITSDITSILLAVASEFIETEKTKKEDWKGDSIEVDNFKNNIVIVPIMRAGMSMMNRLKCLLGDKASISFIDYARDEETLVAKLSYSKISKNLNSAQAIVADPMLATGGTLINCIEEMKKRGIKEENIISLSVISAPEGLEKVIKRFPKIKIITAKLDRELNEKGFIMPGLGDFGDRCFGNYDE